MRPEPPAGTLVRTGNAGIVFVNTGAGEWCSNGPAVQIIATWPELDAGKYGRIELLVGIPYVTEATAGTPDAEVLQRVVEAVLNPVGVMMMQLAQAAGGGITAVVLEAYRRGQADATDAREADHG